MRSKTEVLFGRNLDTFFSDALIFVNKRGVSKTGGMWDPNDKGYNPAQWVSKYGSVTFNVFGRENPTGGMNEAGLVVEVMDLGETQYPKDKSLPALDSLEWVQYELDTSATIEEAIKNAQRVRIFSPYTILHFLISDRTGNAAALEFINGNLVVHTGERLPISVLANDSYEKSVSYLKTASPEKATTASSLDRFVRAAHKTQEFAKQSKSEKESVKYVFDALSDVEQEGFTKWNIVYDQKRDKIHFRTKESPQIKTVETKKFDYSCGTAVKIFDMNSKESGDVTAKFTNYTQKANRNLIEGAFELMRSSDQFKGAINELTPALSSYMAEYAEKFPCSCK